MNIRLACELLTPFDCPCTNKGDPVGLDQSSWKQAYRTTIGSRCPARTRASLSVLVGPTRESTPRLSRVSAITGRAPAESQALFKISVQRLPVKAPPSFTALLWTS